jgi:outer membrane protein TolC
MKRSIFKLIARSAILYVLVLCCNLSMAQTTQTYSLKALVDSVKSHLPLLLQKQALVNSAKASVTDARDSFLPQLNVGEEVSVGTSNDVEGEFLPLSGIIHPISSSIRAGNNPAQQSDNLASAYAQYDLVNFGLRGAKVNNAVAYVNLQQADLDKTLYVLKMQIGKLYFDILKNNYLLTVGRQNVNRYQSIYTIIKALTGSGIKAGVDSSLAIAELSKTKVSYNQRLGVLGQLQQQLSFLTSIPVKRLAIDTIDSKNIPATRLYTAPDSLQNPLIDYYKKENNLYLSNEQLVKKSYLPKVVIGAGSWGRGSSILYNDQYSNLGNGLGFQRFDYVVGVGVTYDLISPFHRRDKLTVSRFQTQAASYDLQQQQLALNNSVAQADVAIATDNKNLLELPLQLQAATDAYNQKLAQYKAGVINLIDLLNASYVLYSAQTNYAETITDWYNANLDKAASTGNLDQFIQTLKK